MLVTATPVPKNLASLLRGCVTPVLKHFQPLPLKEVQRQTWRNRKGLVAPVKITVLRHGNGNIRSLNASLVYPSKSPSYDFRYLKAGPAYFFAEVQIVGSVRQAAESIELKFLDHLVEREVEERYTDGPRELVSLSPDALQSLAEELRRSGHMLDSLYPSGYAAEQLLKGLVHREIDLRAGESAHMRMEAIKRFSKANKKASRSLEEELARAKASEDSSGLTHATFHTSISDDEVAALRLRERAYDALKRSLRH